MRIARFSYTPDSSAQESSSAAGSIGYAFVQKDESDGKDYLVELNGFPLSGALTEPTGRRFDLNQSEIRLLSPVIPSKIFCLARNYRAHADYINEKNPGILDKNESITEKMMIFTKPSTSVVGPDDAIVMPSYSENMNFEPELAIVIGSIAKNVDEASAMNYVLGATCVNDVTLRDLQGSDPMWTRAKGFDTSCPLGPWIETDIDVNNADISFRLNGEEVPQASGNTANLIHSISSQIAFISGFSTLLPGDVIMTGTPFATGTLKPGDEAEVTVGGIGTLRNVVISG